MYVTLKLEMFTVSKKYWLQKKKKQAKVNISVCSLKREVKGQGHKILCWSGRTH